MSNTTAHINQFPLRILIAGGGTGGHIFPALAIAEAIKKLRPETEFLFVGAKGKMEMERVPQAGYKIEGLDIAGFNRSSWIKNISLPLKLVKSFVQVSSILKSFKPQAVIGVGGYSTYPVLRSAQASGIPTFIHESNSFAGKSNILLGKKATKIFVASEGMNKFFPEAKIMLTGNPVRQSIAHSTIDKDAALNYFDLQRDKVTVLVTGGSLGARSVNEAVSGMLAQMKEGGMQLIWQTGKPYFETAKKDAGNYIGSAVHDFISSPEYGYAAADIIISRSGAMSVAELCTVRKPVIFVPYPFAAEDHQTANALALVNNEAALMIPDNAVKEQLKATLFELATDHAKQEKLRENIAKYAVTNADEIIALEILTLINR